ncbi:MAG: hypothetical protein K0S33_342 [Bacteroidetes bacterium]|jgi:uncharacterized delta-60 repeat protein|nr:hypothetical protein [Bacteroidota bacterium]
MEKKMRRTVLKLFVIACFLPFPEFAQQIVPDNSFGTTGIVETDIPGSLMGQSNALTIQSDGKILTAGAAIYSGTSWDFSMIRYNTNGSLDAAFGAGGIVRTNGVFSGTDVLRSVAVQNDGKIVALGTSSESCPTPGVSSSHLVIVRYLPDGSRDSAFAVNGMFIMGTCPDQFYGLSLALQSDGKIVACGSATDSSTKILVLRLDTSGTPDASFGTNGIVTTSVQGYAGSYGTAVSIQADGKIVVGGQAGQTASYDFFIARFHANGSPDNGFAGGGIYTQSVGSEDQCFAVSVQSDGKIVLMGNTASDYTTLIRLDSLGIPDNTFGAGGLVSTFVQTQAGMKFLGSSMVIRSDGKILVGGAMEQSSLTDFSLMQFNTDGTIDNTFDTDGIVITPVGINASSIRAIGIQTDGKIVGTGSASWPDGTNFTVARYIESPVGIGEKEGSGDLLVYPNPTTGKLMLQMNHSLIEKAEVCDVLGAIKYSFDPEKQRERTEMDLSDLPKGVYFLRVFSGKKVIMKKIIVG